MMQHMDVVRVNEGHMRVAIGRSRDRGNPIFTLFTSKQYKKPGGYVPIRDEADQLNPLFAIEIERKEQAQVMIQYLNKIIDQYF